MTHDDIARLFTRTDQSFVFARWGRPIAPVVFGVTDETLPVIKGAFEAMAALTGQQIAETDPELGANCMVFFFRDWAELPEVPNLERLVPDLGPLVDRLAAADANQYRLFRFDENNTIKAVFIFLRMDKDLASVPAETLALSQAVQSVLLWSDTAFQDASPLAVAQGHTVLRPEYALLIRAAYDPVLPSYSEDPSTALRLFARMAKDQAN